jgi:hypothetical protein
MGLLRHHMLLVFMPLFFPGPGLRTGWTLGKSLYAIFTPVALDWAGMKGAWQWTFHTCC